ncbi:MAG: ATP-binding protein [Thermodesulfobacteriota bacterium]|nr:ATP-binding protein [Thermodesulfobacteriota bacterium]
MIREIFLLQNPWQTQANFTFTLKNRNILPLLINALSSPRKILGLIGSRQVGKSSLIFLLIQHLLHHGTNSRNIFYFNLDDLKLHELFDNMPDFIDFIGAKNEKTYVFIDEVQRLENPGLFLKALYDLGLNIKIIYSGSSQLEIKSKLREHLVGRVRQFEIQRLCFEEYIDFNQPITRKEALEEILLYGSYPGVALETKKLEKKLTIKDIYQSYIEKDLVDFLQVTNISSFNTLLGLLANQIGNLLNIENLSKAARLPRKEIERFITILESTFIIKRLNPFHRNYKKEITKTPKIFFLDLGLRNYAINNFNQLRLRNDQGELFENFFFLELLHKDYHGLTKLNYWRTTNQTEIDFILSNENSTEAIEVKWQKETPPKSFKTLQKYYPEIQTKLITRKTFIA